MSGVHHELTKAGDHKSAANADFDWDDRYVRLPCSRSDEVEGRRKWQIVREHFENCKIENFDSLRDAICEYNEEANNAYDYLFQRFNTSMDRGEMKYFFKTLLPRIGKLALELPNLFERIPLLLSGEHTAVTMSQQQVACLVANAFLCTFATQKAGSASNCSGASNSKPLRKRRRRSEFPDFTFLGIFTRPSSSNFAKLKCVLHYFDRIIVRQDELQNKAELRGNLELNSVITFERRVLDRTVEWNKSESRFVSLHVENVRAIEDCVSADYIREAFRHASSSPKRAGPSPRKTSSARQSSSRGNVSDLAEQADFCVWQADFANKFVGGGVLGSGSVQEEILFSIYPECLASLLFTEVLAENEALLIRGAQRYASYSGYANSFSFRSEHFDSELERDLFYNVHSDKAHEIVQQRVLRTRVIDGEQSQSSEPVQQAKFDRFGRRNTLIFAVDAQPFGYNSIDQFCSTYVHRELCKFYAGICNYDSLSKSAASNSSCKSSEIGWLQSDDPVVTGNWGCGAFGGDKQLKALIQLCAAAECGRPLVYCTFRDRALGEQLSNIHRQLVDKGVTVHHVLAFIEDFYDANRDGKVDSDALFHFVVERLSAFE